MTYTISLTDSVSSGLWSSSNSNAIVSSTGVVTGVNYGRDTIIYVVSDPCGASQTTFPLFINQPGECKTYVAPVNEAGSMQLLLFPNPNDGTFTIVVTSDDDESGVLTVSNVLGQKQLQLTIKTNSSTQMKTEFSPGTYFVSAVFGNFIQTKKVVILR